jgi:rhodanese-related sulfurtransferase
MQRILREQGVRSVAVTSVVAEQSRGYTLLDVRPKEDFEAFHPPTAIHVPLFVEIQLDSPAKLIKAALYAFNGMKGTDENTQFVEQVAALVPSKSKLLVLCDSGGTYEGKVGNAEGRRSRSLVAIYKLLDAGFSDLLHVAGGTREWGRAGLSFEGDDPESWSAKAGTMPPTD